MPPPTRIPRGTRPPATPVPARRAPAASNAPSTSTRIDRPSIRTSRDGFDALRPPALAPTPGSAAAIPLGQFGDMNVLVGADGSLRRAAAGDPSIEAGIETLVQVALSNTESKTAFDGVADKAVLWHVADNLTAGFGSYLKVPMSDTQALQFRQGRAATLSLLEAAAVRAGAMGDVPLRDAITQRLGKLIAQEPFRALRDFSYQSAVDRAAEGKLSPVKEFQEAVFPSAPPYKKWLSDGKISMVYYVDNHGSLLEDQLDFLKSLGLKHKKQTNGDHLFTSPAKGGQPAIELRLPKPSEDAKPALFEHMNDKSVDMIVYSGHAGYGHRVDHAIAHGVSGTGDGKVVALYQCWGEGNIESLERAYPDAQVLSTTEMTSDDLDQIHFARMLQGFKEKKGWAAIQKDVVASLHKNLDPIPEIASDFHLDTHYTAPHMQAENVKHYDRDQDAVKDRGDHFFNVVYPKRIDAAGGYNPVVQAVPSHSLDGTALNKSLNNLSLVMRYNKFLGDAPAVPWGPEAVVGKGFFTPEPGDLRAFRFNIDAATKKLNVEVSARFAHTPDKALARMLGYEAGLFLGQKAGLDEAGKTALGLAMLDRAIDQQGGQNEWYASSGMLTEPWAEESLLQARYGIGGMPLKDVTRALNISEHDDGGPQHLQALTARVRETTGLSAAGGSAPVAAGTPVEVREDVPLPSSEISVDVLQRALSRLGIEGAVQSYSPKWLNSNEPNNLVAVVTNAAGKTFQVGIGIDSQGLVRSAATLDLKLDRVKEQAVDEYLATFAEKAGVSRDELLATRKQESGRGTSLSGSLARTLASVRTRIPPGTDVPRPSALEQFVSNGYASDAEFKEATGLLDRAYPQGGALEAERALFAWVDAAADAARLDKAALRQAYLAPLAAADGRSAAGQGIAAVLEAMPNPVPSVSTLPSLVSLLSSGLVTAADASMLMPALRARAGVTDASLVKDLLEKQWLSSYESDATKTACRTAVDAALRENRPVADVVVAAATAYRNATSSSLNIDAGQLEALGLVKPSDLTALRTSLDRLASPA